MEISYRTFCILLKKNCDIVIMLLHHNCRGSRGRCEGAEVEECRRSGCFGVSISFVFTILLGFWISGVSKVGVGVTIPPTVVAVLKWRHGSLRTCWIRLMHSSISVSRSTAYTVCHLGRLSIGASSLRCPRRMWG